MINYQNYFFCYFLEIFVDDEMFKREDIFSFVEIFNELFENIGELFEK